MKNYTFIAQCRSGQVKTTTFQASSYLEARTKLQEFIDNN